MKFKNVYSLKTPDGVVRKINAKEGKLWARIAMRYVSLGDSIAAGQGIRSDSIYWPGECYSWQYGTEGVPSTAIVPGSYADLIRAEMAAAHGADYISAKSFARSGDTVADLMEKLTHDQVREAISKADLVTVCIGANDVLVPAMNGVGAYIDSGAIDDLAKDVETNLATLNNDAAPTSYKALFNRLMAINPKAQFVFTTVYNPFKYLWLEESTSGGDYKDGFFGPLMWAIPDSLIGDTLANAIRGAFYGTPKVQDTIKRVNSIGSLAEGFVTRLNTILRNKINAYGNANLMLADTKAVFDPVPDRPISAPRHYNDLVNVEVTRGHNIDQMDWGKFWEGVDWWNAVNNIDQIADIVVDDVIEEVILPDVDPHPEEYGQYALKCSFVDALGWSTLPRRTITFNANGGKGSMAAQTVVALDNMTAYANINALAFTIPAEGYRWTGWLGGNGQTYTNGQFIGLSGNLALSAQWSNIYVINVRHSEDSNYHGSGDTGPMECYALWIDGEEQSDLGAFSNGSHVYNLPYGSKVGVIVQTKSGSDRSYITLNGEKISGSSGDARYTFTVTSHMDIHFEWNYWLDGLSPQSYWNCYVTTY